MTWDLIIIGGGVAGLAVASEVSGIKTLLLEKNDKCGKKLLLSGAGQCNITHAGSIKDYEGKFGGKWRFVRNPLNEFTNIDLIEKFKKINIEMVTMDNNKVFPKSLKASDILDGLERIATTNEVKININETVLSIDIIDEKLVVKTSKSEYITKKLVISTGGFTFKNTGSTGDGYKFAKKIGLDVVEPRFALAPIYLDDHKLKKLSGVSFEDAFITHFSDNKKVNEYKGDLLITHFGYSGPVIINSSRYMKKNDKLKINFTKYNSKEEIDKILLKFLSSENKKTIKSIINMEFLPKRLTDEMFLILDIDANTKASELKKIDRKRIVSFMCEYEITITHVGKEHIAMVTAGGISINELNKKTLALKKNKNIYFVGECIDVDGDTGGYNIQYAFSSGVVAARNIIKEIDNDIRL